MKNKTLRIFLIGLLLISIQSCNLDFILDFINSSSINNSEDSSTIINSSSNNSFEESSSILNSSSSSETNSSSSSLIGSSSTLESSTIIEQVKVIDIELLENTFDVNENNQLKMKVTYSDLSEIEIEVLDQYITGNLNLSVAGTYVFDITYEDYSESFKVNVTNYESILLDSNDYVDGISQYSTGNYVSYYTNYTNFEFYRANRNDSSKLTSLLPKETMVDINSLGGALYNTTCIDDIKSINIKYKSVGDVNLLYGLTRASMNSITLEKTGTTFKEKEIKINDANFFMIETISTSVQIDYVEIIYSGIRISDIYYDNKCNENLFRINPVTYSGTLVSGVSYVDVPIDVTRNGNSYIVNKTKRYTYYTYSDVSSNKSLASKASYTDPMDVANYFIAFKTYPANYVVKKSYSAAYSIFKEDTRCVSTYSRTNGYATSVPYAAGSDGKPTYYECDIALSSSYSSSNRGTGRLVVWEYGFDEIGYDDSIVAVYTDDHYATFTEYLNNGLWGDHFNAEFNRSCYDYSSAKTLS